jgi:two-component system sensor histidine kinase KdpD
VLEVTDNGRGIPADQRDRLFDPADRADGHGRGLFLARAFAWNHGGKVQIKSGPTGIGTTVVVTLPLRGVHAGE